MKKAIFAILMVVSLFSQAQKLPPYDRSRSDQVLSDREVWSRYYQGLPKGATPFFPANVPDSLKGNAYFHVTGTGSLPRGLYNYNPATGLWALASGTGYALDANVVHKTGNETIADLKVFSSNVTAPTFIGGFTTVDGGGEIINMVGKYLFGNTGSIEMGGTMRFSNPYRHVFAVGATEAFKISNGGDNYITAAVPVTINSNLTVNGNTDVSGYLRAASAPSGSTDVMRLGDMSAYMLLNGSVTRNGYFGNIGAAEFNYSGKILAINGPNLYYTANNNKIDLGNGTGIRIETANNLTLSAGTVSLNGPVTFDTRTIAPGYSATAVNGTGGLLMAAQTTRPATPATGFAQIFYNSNGLSWITPTGYIRSFLGTGLTADRIYTLPDATGTMALTSNPVSTFTNDAGYHTNTTGDLRYVQLASTYANPSWITSLLYSKISSVPANSIMGNVTGSAASAAAVAYFDSGEQSYSGTVVWTGTTAPSGTASHSYQWMRIGKQVSVRMTLSYTVAGTALSLVTAEFPTDLPAPHVITGYTAGDMNYMGWGGFSVSKTNSIGTAGRLSIRQVGGIWKITCTQTTGDFLVGHFNFVYYTD